MSGPPVRQPRAPISNRLIASGVLLCFATAVVSFVLLRNWVNRGFEPVAFTVDTWAEADAELRGRMADDLLGKHVLEGMTRVDIIALLGEPDEDQKDLKRFRYHLGHRNRNPDAPFFTTFSLMIWFNGDGRATDVLISD